MGPFVSWRRDSGQLTDMFCAPSATKPPVFYVVNDGDCWITNLLFQTDPVTKVLLPYVFLDFQVRF